VVLATIFERDRKWGQSSDPRSATFQWEHAENAARQVRLRDRSAPATPGINRSLGNCYQIIGRPNDAWGQFMLAAQGLAAVDKDEARAALRRAADLNLALTAEQQAMVTKTKEAIERPM